VTTSAAWLDRQAFPFETRYVEGWQQDPPHEIVQEEAPQAAVNAVTEFVRELP
jgi:hypothetical protein